jgi:hypothetical protein
MGYDGITEQLHFTYLLRYAKGWAHCPVGVGHGSRIGDETGRKAEDRISLTDLHKIFLTDSQRALQLQCPL